MKIPCEECITYAICRIVVRERSNSIVGLYHKKSCELLGDYINKPISMEVHRHRVNMTRILFGLPPVTWHDQW